MQTRTQSMIEAWTNIAVGLAINLLANHLIFPVMFGYRISMGENLLYAALMTLISLARSYGLRRWFNRRHR